ncbi:hypothetical protein QIH77_02850 [Bradyrhizobium diazoefficiens]|uniref:hypothetical protein n=1 Tax=Bradyrhizobium diazoefficiens TaxID=1355477 RepID=UPI00272D2371|nr:hypothetical protein [Bradyrhizobium diazoefficiens]WLA74192.1 hypothetical protein QIH77_02850 [Bradyrhizobium diazoefficiens]
MTAYLIAFAIVALLAVIAGELSLLPWRKRLADAGRSGCRRRPLGGTVPEIHRKLEVQFSKAEIEAILAERSRALVLSRRDVKRIELEQVQHVEGEAVVTLVIGNKEVLGR